MSRTKSRSGYPVIQLARWSSLLYSNLPFIRYFTLFESLVGYGKIDNVGLGSTYDEDHEITATITNYGICRWPIHFADF